MEYIEGVQTSWSTSGAAPSASPEIQTFVHIHSWARILNCFRQSIIMFLTAIEGQRSSVNPTTTTQMVTKIE